MAVLSLLGVAPSPVSASTGEANVAGLIVDYGNGRVSYALVPFAEPEISGFDLLDRSGLSLLAIEFGGLGQGVCAIEGTGCDVAACRARLCQSGDPDSPFWQYAQLGSDGTWVTSPLGATTSTVTDGGIDAWAWSGDSPNPGPTTIDEIANHLGVDLAAMRAGDTGPVSITPGGTSNASRAIGWQETTAVVLLAGIAVAGGISVRRARRSGAASS